MMSNNFVELKGSVFKKFAKANLFQMACRSKIFLALFLVSWQGSNDKWRFFVASVNLFEEWLEYLKHSLEPCHCVRQLPPKEDTMLFEWREGEIPSHVSSLRCSSSKYDGSALDMGAFLSDDSQSGQNNLSFSLSLNHFFSFSLCVYLSSYTLILAES